MVMRFKILADLEWIISWIEFKTYTYTLTDESTCVCVCVCVYVCVCERACVKKKQEMLKDSRLPSLLYVCEWI